jgi:hypothetical protein
MCELRISGVFSLGLEILPFILPHDRNLSNVIDEYHYYLFRLEWNIPAAGIANEKEPHSPGLFDHRNAALSS